MKAISVAALIFFVAVIGADVLRGCRVSPSPSVQRQDSSQKPGQLRRQRDDVRYELLLRRAALDVMIVNDASGFRKLNLTRKAELEEQIIQLEVKIYDLDSQIEVQDCYHEHGNERWGCAPDEVMHWRDCLVLPQLELERAFFR